VRCVAVVFPRSLLALRGDELARLAAVRIPGDRGAGALISSLARQLPEHLDGCNESAGARLGSAVLDLLMVALAGRLDRTSELPRQTRRRALLQRVHAFIEQRLGDPELSPGCIAAAQYISVRSLHKLFEAQQTTVTEWIRRRRLERCARDLLDPGAGRRGDRRDRRPLGNHQPGSLQSPVPGTVRRSTQRAPRDRRSPRPAVLVGQFERRCRTEAQALGAAAMRADEHPPISGDSCEATATVRGPRRLRRRLHRSPPERLRGARARRTPGTLTGTRRRTRRAR
jgi:AraC-like DNA-binding protein